MRRHCVAVSILLLLSGAGSAQAQSGGVTLLGQERRLEAFASFGDPGEPERLVFNETGPFVETVQKVLRDQTCIPGKCIDKSIAGTATQDSLISIVDGTLDVRAHGVASSGAILATGTAGALSVISTAFHVASAVPYVLGATLSGATSIVLSHDNGAVISHHNYSGRIDESGVLPAGLYALTVVASTRATDDHGEFDVRFTTAPAGGAVPPDRASCRIDISGALYSVGDVVTAREVRITSGAEAVAVELKMWLRVPSGLFLSASNVGADGTLILPRGISHDFGPFPLLGVAEESEKGTYEFGCRVLDPLTGRELSTDSAEFLVQ